VRVAQRLKEIRHTVAQRLEEIWDGFRPSFWVANFTELFERLAYYGPQAVLAIYLHEHLGLTTEQATWLIGYYGFVVWFMPIVGGALADRFGFRRTLAGAFFILAAGNFLLGSLSASWMAPIRDALPLFALMHLLMLIPAMGPAVVKPVVVGTTARAADENVRSVGYSIYYTVVNIGAALGPITASLVRRSVGVEDVFLVSAGATLAMAIVTLLFYREPARDGGAEAQVATVAQAFRNLVQVMGRDFLMLLAVTVGLWLVWHFTPVPALPTWILAVYAAVLVLLFLRTLLKNPFFLFLIIFSGFWVVFWQQYLSLPIYVRTYVNPNANIDALLSVEATTVILLTVVVNQLTRRIPPFIAIIAGVLISSLSWLFLTAGSATIFVVAALIVLAIGEVVQAPRYYEYISRLAPQGQQGLYMGYAFLPIGIGYLIGGRSAGWLLRYFGEVRHQPALMWYFLAGAGVLTTILLILYNRFVRPKETTPVPPSS
jgi:POT family proton-dependent oligopeptide transporter